MGPLEKGGTAITATTAPALAPAPTPDPAAPASVGPPGGGTGGGAMSFTDQDAEVAAAIAAADEHAAAIAAVDRHDHGMDEAVKAQVEAEAAIRAAAEHSAAAAVSSPAAAEEKGFDENVPSTLSELLDQVGPREGSGFGSALVRALGAWGLGSGEEYDHYKFYSLTPLPRPSWIYKR